MEMITNSETTQNNYQQNFFSFNQSPNEEGKLEDDPFSFKKGEETIASLTDYACNFKENCDRIKM